MQKTAEWQYEKFADWITVTERYQDELIAHLLFDELDECEMEDNGNIIEALDATNFERAAHLIRAEAETHADGYCDSPVSDLDCDNLWQELHQQNIADIAGNLAERPTIYRKAVTA